MVSLVNDLTSYVNRITSGIDARALPIPDQSTNCIVTSPPYFGLRVYGNQEGEIGRDSLATYLQSMGHFFDEAHRVLAPDGVFWLNIGDTAAGSGGAGGDYNRGGNKAGKPRYRQGESGVVPPQWILVPQRLALLAQERGWLIRSWITWDKGGRRPESLAHVKRPGIQSEVILMMVKQRKYKFFPDRLEDKGDVWSFGASRSKRSHLAPFPEELPTRCILASTEPNDVVLDPFAGSGTTIDAARRLNRHGVGFDLYDYS